MRGHIFIVEITGELSNRPIVYHFVLTMLDLLVFVTELDTGRVHPRVESGRVEVCVSSGGWGRVKKFEYFYSRFSQIAKFCTD
jgi:hypothetical protein